jgi:glycosyltransferase involved in cell wall biosynthesis
MISVVVTTWGKQPKACLQSVRAQNVVKEIIQIENGNGACAARNEGAAKATGEYIIFVDGDIMLMPGVLKKMADILEALPEIAFVYGDYRRTGAWK